mgnify:CR=1 FL=1
MKISAFCLTTNAVARKYPFIESIKSFLPIVDELVVIDGGSTDGTLEAIRSIGDQKIKIVCDQDTKWEEDWFYSRMSHNFNRGWEECTGDVVFKFDVDWVFHEERIGGAGNKYNFRTDCEQMEHRGKCMLKMNRLNHILIDRHYIKKETPFLVFRNNCKQRGFNIKWGLDMERWGWGNIPIIGKYQENGIWFGYMLDRSDMDYSCAIIHVYDFSFADQETIRELRYRNYSAIVKQAGMKWRQTAISKPSISFENLNGDRGYVFDHWRASIEGMFARPQTQISLEKHPAIMKEKIKVMTTDMYGYGAFGWLKEKFSIEKANYFL